MTLVVYLGHDIFDRVPVLFFPMLVFGVMKDMP